jgi:paxillin
VRFIIVPYCDFSLKLIKMGNLKGSNTNAVTHNVCSHCGKPITGPRIEASGKCYHPEHFVCMGCNRSLHGLDYYEPDGKAHCTTCYHKQLPSCVKCGQKILSRAVTLSEINKAWHPDHFTCAECEVNLEGIEFYTQNGSAYCAQDYHRLFSLNCAQCKKRIQGEVVTTRQKLHYHPACFLCHTSGCGRKLGGIPYYEHNNHVYCEAHYHAVATLHCPCGKTIQGQYVSALGKTWHPEHFVCYHCKKQLMGGVFAENDAQVYCADCDSKLFPE